MLVENEESSSRDSTVYGVAVYAVIVYMDPKTVKDFISQGDIIYPSNL